MYFVRLGYIDETCAVLGDDIPYIRGTDDCAVNDTETCEEVHIYSTFFAVTPSFSCKVVVSIAPILTLYDLREHWYIHDITRRITYKKLIRRWDNERELSLSLTSTLQQCFDVWLPVEMFCSHSNYALLCSIGESSIVFYSTCTISS